LSVQAAYKRILFSLRSLILIFNCLFFILLPQRVHIYVSMGTQRLP
jgi:hypothetical protein